MIFKPGLLFGPTSFMSKKAVVTDMTLIIGWKQNERFWRVCMAKF